MRLLRPRLTGADMAAFLLGGAAILVTAYLSVRAAPRSASVCCWSSRCSSRPSSASSPTRTSPPPQRWCCSCSSHPQGVHLAGDRPTEGSGGGRSRQRRTHALSFERRRPDRLVLALVLLLLGLYVINPGGSHGIAWVQGVRLVGEPLLLLLVGSCFQAAPDFSLAPWGRSSSVLALCGLRHPPTGRRRGQARQLGLRVGHADPVRLRSSAQLGTARCAIRLCGAARARIAAVFFWLRRGPLAWGAALFILGGLWVSYVRTSILFLVGWWGWSSWRWNMSPPP